MNTVCRMGLLLRKMHKIHIALIAVGAIIITYQIYATNYEEELKYSGSGLSVILWWTPFGSEGKIRNCGSSKCYFTQDRSFQSHHDLKSVLFYGSSIEVDDLPDWRPDNVPWGLLHEESPRNNPILVHEEALNLFFYSATFSRHSDVPLTLLDLPDEKILIEKKFFVPTETKTKLMREENLAPVLYIQSDCDTASDRDSYVRELMKYIRIDAYGACLNNAQLNPKFKKNYLEDLVADEFLSFVAKYKFALAFENAVCQDYITEKLWRPLIVGSVPVYYGSPSFKDWLPENLSAISVRDFESPKTLADFLQNLNEYDSEYDLHLSHKLKKNYEIQNENLLRGLRKKGFRKEFGNYVEEFECLVCKSVDKNEVRKAATKKIYECPLPVDPLNQKLDEGNWWLKEWKVEKCGAKLLVYHLKNNISINSEEFARRKYEMFEAKEC